MTKQIVLIICIFIFHASNAQYRNLVLEGGGIRGAAYAGAMSVLEEKGILKNIEKVAGTSAGSVVGLMVSLGYTSKEIDSILFHLKIEKFNDGHGGLLGKYRRLKRHYGIHKGKEFGKWIEHLIQTKTGNPAITFRQLDSLSKYNPSIKKLYCVGANLTRQRTEIFSFETTPDILVKTAIRISCSIPFYYESILLDSTGKEMDKSMKTKNFQVYVDGGIVANYPINIFDSCQNGINGLFCDPVIHNKETLGIKLERDEQIESLSRSSEIPPIDIYNFNDYIRAFLNLCMETINRKPNLENELGRTIYIGYGHISFKPRKMTDKEKKDLFENGRLATLHFLSK
ncbi:MAG TPA: patatin-like phospholipase family protein [Ferruginibacter sp.]|nr:patatin-like phospholipase family protein [Ferruginibacter sp.]